MESEYDSIMANDTCDLVPLPKDKKGILCKWVYKCKDIPGDLMPQYKACLVSKGYAQQKEIDFDETFLPVGEDDHFTHNAWPSCY